MPTMTKQLTEGWIVLTRQIMDTAFYKNPKVCHLAIHLLLKANHKETKFIFNKQEAKLRRGQCLTGLLALAKETGMTTRNVRTALVTLSNTEFLTSKATNRFRVITITKYDEYQSISKLKKFLSDNQVTSRKSLTTHSRETHFEPKLDQNPKIDKQNDKQNTDENNLQTDKQSDNQVTIKRQSSDNQMTTYNECKQCNNDKEVKEVKEKEIDVFEKSPAFASKSKTFLKSWSDYLDMRVRIRRPATIRAKELILLKLDKLAPEDEKLQIAILEQSVENSWQGVFALRQERGKAVETSHHPQAPPGKYDRFDHNE